jgi:hypothetical protein
VDVVGDVVGRAFGDMMIVSERAMAAPLYLYFLRPQLLYLYLSPISTSGGFVA